MELKMHLSRGGGGGFAGVGRGGDMGLPPPAEVYQDSGVEGHDRLVL